MPQRPDSNTWIERAKASLWKAVESATREDHRRRENLLRQILEDLDEA